MNQIKYVENAYSKSGTVFKDDSLENILSHCTKLPKNGKKGEYGSIFIYNSQQLGVHDEDVLSTGIILIDIDNISKELSETIYDNFDLISANWTSLLAIQYSSSYYIKPNKSGLHIFVKSYELTKEEYNQQSQLCLSIFAQLVYIILKIDLSKNLDFHNTNLYQRFNLFYSSFKYNEFAEPFELNQISYEDLEKLVEKYDLKLDKQISKTISPFANNVVIGDINKKLKIDRKFHIGNYSGNDIRFRISIIADKLFGDNAKSFCDKFFYYEDNKSIYNHYPSGNIINPLIYKWLIENKYITENNNNVIENWIDEYSEDIMKEIKKNHFLEIVAPTGTGKTTFINDYLAHQLNSVVIVPFNVTNKLYNKLFEVNANYSGDLPKNKPIVMIWDQAIKHWNEIRNRHIIIDEAHTLFFDRNYRDVAIKLIMYLKEDKPHTTFITATPAGEKELFEMKQIRYWKKRDTINLNIKATRSIEWSQYNYIKKAIDNNWYDKIVLLDDTSAKKIYEKFVINGYACDICYIRSSTKETEDFIMLRNDELLKKKLTICTCVAFNGLNFKNTNEKILVMGSIQLGNTTSCEIIQQIGRIRNSKVSAVYFFNPEKHYKNDIDEKVLKSIEYNNIYLKGVPDTFLSYNHKWLDNNYVIAMKNIEDYNKEHSNMDNIINELSETGYIKGKIEDKLPKESESVVMNLSIKRKESDELKKDIENDVFLNNEYTSEYKKKWSEDICYMISNSWYSGITIDTFKTMFKNSNKHKLVETYIKNIKEIIRYIQVDEQEYNKTMNNINLYAAMLSNQVDKKQFISNMKRIKEIREKYVGMVKFVNNNIYLDDIITDVIQFEADNMKKEIDGGKKGGKKGKKIIIDDIEYDTISDAANKLGISRTALYKRMKKEK